MQKITKKVKLSKKSDYLSKGFDFDAVKVSVASPQEISAWSHGEVVKPETINYRTQKPERDGLFCERIFGPTKDWECYCGKYKKIRYKGVICDKCGVEITRSSVRRERMGHIDLAAPVAHIWYIRGVPSVLGTILDLSVGELERVIYFASYVVLEVNQEIKDQALEQLEKEYQELKSDAKDKNPDPEIDAAYRQIKQEINSLKVKSVISEAKFQDLSMKYGQIVRVGIGAEAIFELLKKVNLDTTITELQQSLDNFIGVAKRRNLKRLRLLSDMKNADILPEWLILTKLPVIPPDLRPMVQLDGGRFAASDLNDLYRRILNRNNRLKKLNSQGAPEVICRNEKRMLQEAVDALIDNSARRGKVVSAAGGQRKLRSLSDMLRGKQGRFRQNLLGKRVDYSGRSVIVVGPELKLHQCGIPKTMALELFKPFVISKLISEGYVHNVKNASRLIEKGVPEVWDILERVTSEAYVLLNRAPTLHRLGIQAFQPILIEGKAIQVHPLVCLAFNADFDGDQMAVHVPLSEQARYEAKTIMCSAVNLLKPASGEPIVTPRLDIVFGCYYLTSLLDGALGEGKIFMSKNEAIYAYHMKFLHLRAKVKIMMSPKADAPEELVETSVGRILFNLALPKKLRYRNQTMDSKTLKKLVKECFDLHGIKTTAETVDNIKQTGFEYAGLSGMTISISDIQVPAAKDAIIAQSDHVIEDIDRQYRRGLITDTERGIKSTELWMRTKSHIEKEMLAGFDKNNPVFIMVSSGARGSKTQLTQMAGMKGLMVNPAGEIIEVPIKSNFKEGLSELEFFISTHGARKGKSDTALRTSDAGYLTRRLVDVAQDIIITQDDCLTKEGSTITKSDSDSVGIDFTSRLVGRYTTEAVRNPQTKKIIVGQDKEINETLALKIAEAQVDKVLLRSPIYCQLRKGICQKCYGRDLATGQLVNKGEVVGIMAAQAIGEPGTQLTLKTFHMGGVTGEDITTGLPRVEELFEARTPRIPAVIAEIDGEIKINTEKDSKTIVITSSDVQSETHIIPAGYKIIIKDGQIVKAKQSLAVAVDKKALRAKIDGRAIFDKNKIVISSLEKIARRYAISPKVVIKVGQGQKVMRGEILTEGHIDLTQALRLQGKLQVQNYIVKGIQEIYNSQGQNINDKHIEIILRQMFSKVYIKDGGDSQYLSGQIVNRLEILDANEQLKKNSSKEIVCEDILLGVTRIALKTESFLSAASFQETTGVLIDAAIKGKVDNLNGLKENVIIGKLIPAGTALKNIKLT